MDSKQSKIGSKRITKSCKLCNKQVFLFWCCSVILLNYNLGEWCILGVDSWRRLPQRNPNRSCGMTKYRKGPTKDRKGALRAKLQEIGTNWTQWCLIFQCAPTFFTCCRTELRTWLEGAVRAAAAARPARCVLVGMRRRCCMARINQHLLMAAWPSCTVQMLGSRRRPSADRTKQEAKTVINLCRGLKMVIS